MKKIFLLLSLLYVFYSSAQTSNSESVTPTFDVKLDRMVSLASIEGKTFTNVIIELDAAEEYPLLNKGVKVTIKDVESGKKIYKKRFSRSYLYAFSDGTIQVGKGNAIIQVVLSKYKEEWLLRVRENGLY